MHELKARFTALDYILYFYPYSILYPGSFLSSCCYFRKELGFHVPMTNLASDGFGQDLPNMSQLPVAARLSEQSSQLFFSNSVWQ